MSCVCVCRSSRGRGRGTKSGDPSTRKYRRPAYRSQFTQKRRRKRRKPAEEGKETLSAAVTCINPQDAYVRRVTIVGLCVCVSVTTLVATWFVSTVKLRYVCITYFLLFSVFNLWIFTKKCCILKL